MTTSNFESQVSEPPSPISHLPLELLTCIFLIFKSRGNHTRPHNHPSITVSQVSRQWRAVAIGCPDLWTDINVKYPRWAEEMLRRSQNALIHIHSSFPKPTQNQVIASRIALREIHRVKGLTLMASRDTLEILFNVLPNVAPHLDFLEFCSIVKTVDYSHLIPGEGVICGTTCGTAHLRHLDLEGFRIKWESPFLRGLTHLSLDQMSLKISPTLSQFIDVLQTMPMLEYLFISTYITSDSDANLSEIPPTHIAELPHLKIFDFLEAFHLKTCTYLMERLLLPSECKILIEMPYHEDQDNDELEVYLKRLLTNITTAKSYSSQEQQGSLFPTAIIDFFDFFRLRLSHAHFPTHDTDIEDSPYVELESIPVIGTKANTIRILMETLPLPYLESLYVNTFIEREDDSDFSSNIDRFFWEALLPVLPNIRQIEIGGISAISFLEILSRLDTERTTTENDSRQLSDSGLCLPLLERVGFRSVTFGDMVRHPFSTKQLYDFCLWKFAYRANFQGISLTDCLNLTETDEAGTV